MMPLAARLSMSPNASMTLLIISKLRDVLTSEVMPLTAFALESSIELVSRSGSVPMILPAVWLALNNT